jgi:hypothetical protein
MTAAPRTPTGANVTVASVLSSEHMMSKCCHCNEDLAFIPGIGNVHPNGAVIATRVDERTGELVDDHVALPLRDHGAIRVGRM